MYTSVNYHGTEDPGFIQVEYSVPDPTQLPNSPQKVNACSKLHVLYHKCHSQKFAHEGYVALSRASDRYPRN